MGPPPLQIKNSNNFLKSSTIQIHSEKKELVDKFALNRPLRIKLGADPTSPDLHLGHSILLEKLRQFQELGHTAVIIIGDFTAMIGDPSGRSVTRPQLSQAQIAFNSKTYTDQIFKILDRNLTEIHYNSDWFSKMTFSEVIRLNSTVTLQQMLQREDFRDRVNSGNELRLHEIQYPIMQGWDSVQVNADIEIGGTDQLFNLFIGRDLQKNEGQVPQVVITVPLLVGLDGVKKMSKSYNNYIGITESPQDMFGKIMSISDKLMHSYYGLLFEEMISSDIHPMEAKKQLAIRVISRYHHITDAAIACSDWETRFSKKDLTSSILPTFTPNPNSTLLSICIQAYRDCFGITKSNADIRRLLRGNSIRVNNIVFIDPATEITFVYGDILRLDKTHAVSVN